jgi:ABC-type multidrug transport system fused ATPase/permease subunit
VDNKFLTNSNDFVFGLIVALYYVWQLALLICAAIPLMIALIGGLSTVMASSAESSNAAYNAAGSTAQETLGSVRTLFSLGGERKEIKKYGEQLEVAEAAGIKQWFSTSLVLGMVSMVMWLLYALGLWFGAYLIARDMDARVECRYYILPNGLVHQPESSCITGGNVMICFFSILFGYVLDFTFIVISISNVKPIEL